MILTPARYIFSPPFTEHVPASEKWYQEGFGSLKPRVRTPVVNFVSFALPLHRNNDGFQSCTDAGVVMPEPEVWEEKNAIGPVPGSPEQNGLRQGNRVLSEEDLAQVALIPSGVKPFALDAHFQGSFVFQKVMADLPQRGYVLRSVILTHSAMVFPNGHVQGPVQGVFDGPVASDDSQQLFRRGREAADVVAGLAGWRRLWSHDGPPL